MLIAVNRHLIDKASREDFAKHHGKFENLDLDAAAVAREIKNGHAFCPQHKPGKRSTQGFSGAGFLAVDIDHGLTLEAAKADEYFRRYATILYTTPSHKPDAHRFRIVFELEQSIDRPERMQAALTGLIARFGGDKSCKDPCRLFYGSTSSTPEVYGHKLPASEVEALVMRAEERTVLSDTSADGGARRSAVRSRVNIPRDTTLRTERGVVAPLKDVPTGTKVFCPQHVDTRPSAFTLRNAAGNPGLYCSACVATFFLEDGRDRRSKPYRFDYHWRSILDVSYDEYTAHANDEGIVDLSELRGGRIRVLNQRHLAFDELHPMVSAPEHVRFNADGSISKTSDPSLHFDMPDTPAKGLAVDCRLTLVKSPKGTGKTEWLGKLVTAYRAQGASVLLIGHRRSLIAATSNRIGLTSYLATAAGDEDDKSPSYVPPTAHYAVCVDSMPKMDPKEHRYDVVLIDEVEQVFAHLLSDTLKDDRREALHTLRHYLRNAKALYALDADLSNVTVELLHAVFGDDSPDYQAIVNQWQPTGRTVQLYDQTKHDQLLGELVSSLARHERCFVCSNSKKFIEEIQAGVASRVPRALKTLLVTSDNSQSAEVQEIIRNIKKRALEYDAIFTSPALGTGIDITFEDDAQHIDAVFGFFRARINTHFDIDQQLARVRNPGRVCVWVSPEEFRFETDAEAIKAEILASEAEHQRFLRIESDGTKIYDRDEFYEAVYSTVTAAQRASKNRLKSNFIDLRQSDGWSVEFVGKDEDLTQSGKEAARQGKEERRRVGFERILGARRLTSEEYDELRRAEEKEQLRDDDAPAMRRYEAESFYLQDATIELLEEDDERRLRSAISWYETLMAPDEELRRRDSFAESSLTPDKPQHGLKKKLLQELLQSASLMRSGSFDRAAVIDASVLGSFASRCFESKAQIERLLELNVRTNVRKDPITQIKTVLKLLGLGLVLHRRDQSGGGSRILYRLDAGRLDAIERWASRRADSDLREQWKRERSVADEPNEATAPSRREASVFMDPLDLP